MKISNINEFILLAEKRNFTEAASELFISQSTLSKHITDLESELGITLLYRDKHKVELTDAGALVYKHFRKIQGDFAALEESLTSYKESLSGCLRCGFLYYFIDEYVNPILKMLSDNIPTFQPQLSYYQPLPLISALEKGDIDIAVTYHYQYENASQYQFLDFSAEKPMVFFGKNHPFRKKDSVSFLELEEETFVCLRSRPYLNFFLRIMKSSGIEEPDITYCDQIDALDFVLNQTKSISLMPESVRNMVRKDLYFIPVTDAKLDYPVTVVYKKDNQNPLIPLVLKNISRMYKNRL